MAGTAVSAGAMQEPESTFPELPGARALTPAEYAHAQALVTSALGSTHFSDKKQHSEREVELAEFEMRLRTFTMDLIKPTILKARMLEHDMGDLRAAMAENNRTLKELSNMSAQVEQQVLVVEGFREDLNRWDGERRRFQTETVQALSDMHHEVDRLAGNVEQQDFAIHGVQRSAERMGEELAKAQQDTATLKEQMENRFAQTNKAFNLKTSDLEVKLQALEARHDKLQDDLFGNGKGLSKLTHDLKLTDDLAQELRAEVDVMKKDRAKVVRVDNLEQDMQRCFSQTGARIDNLVQRLESEASELKANFKSTANSVSAHNASMIYEMRIGYRQELYEFAKSRTEFMKFMQEAQSNIERLESALGASQGQAEEARKKIMEDIDALESTRRRDRAATEVETASIRERVDNALGASDEVSKCMGHMSAVLWMLLQSERAASALDMQDDQDRTKVALMGYRDHSLSGPGGVVAPPMAARTRSTTPCSGPSRPRSRAAGAAVDLSGQRVLSLDNKCMSCQGQSQAVQTAFKMACLQYAPGPVSFARKLYNRSELLDLRDKLLHRACDSLQHGPVGFKPPEADQGDGQSTQPPSGPSPLSPVTSHGAPADSLAHSGSRSSVASNSAPSLPPVSARSARSWTPS